MVSLLVYTYWYLQQEMIHGPHHPPADEKDDDTIGLATDKNAVDTDILPLCQIIDN
jgi:hypothetical protein